LNKNKIDENKNKSKKTTNFGGKKKLLNEDKEIEKIYNPSKGPLGGKKKKMEF
jgi:hypothetical protein